MEALKSQIESLLFISAKPMSVKQLADLTKSKDEDLKKAGDELVEEYKNNKKGIQIIKNGSKFQMVSSPENAKIVQEFLKDETTGDLSRPSLETLTIIAYRGPISKFDLNRIRGVNCALIIRNLLIRGLIEAKKDKKLDIDTYSVTFDFIRFLGINDVKELPDYERLSKDDTIDQVVEAEKAIEEKEKEEKMIKKDKSEEDKKESELQEKKDEEQLESEDIHNNMVIDNTIEDSSEINGEDMPKSKIDDENKNFEESSEIEEKNQTENILDHESEDSLSEEHIPSQSESVLIKEEEKK